MIQAIIDNPYRILGVYSNAKDNEVLESASKLLYNPSSICETDFNIDGLPSPRRDFDTINWAKQKVLDVNESVKYKLFWFMKTPDNAGIKELMAGDIGQAQNVWNHSLTNESAHNRIIGDLIYDNFSLAAYNAFVLLFKQGYRTNCLRSDKKFPELIGIFKEILYDESNSASLPVSFNGTWKKHVQDDIFDILSGTITSSFTERAKKQINPQSAPSYLSALSTLSSSWWHLSTLREFIGVGNEKYDRLVYDICFSVQSWIEYYLSKSQDILKYRNISTLSFTFSSFTPDKIQSAYLTVLGFSMQTTNNMQILPETCDLCIRTASTIYKFYIGGKKNSSSYLTVMRETAPVFITLKRLVGENHECYRSIANFLAKVGLNIIKQELSGEIIEQTVIDCSTIICYIDRVIDGKLLYEPNRNDRNKYMDVLWDLGLNCRPNSRFPHVLGKVNYDFALYLDEDTTFKSYCSSLNGCQNYLKRFPNGKYAKEVQNMILRNEFKKADVNLSSNGSKPVAQPIRSNTSNTTQQSSSLDQKKQKAAIIEISSLYKYIIIATLLELICGAIFGNKPMLIVGFILAYGYWIVSQTSNVKFEVRSKRLMGIYIVVQSIISVVGLIMLH